jgi:capsular polysaccharide biosynthesis protein
VSGLRRPLAPTASPRPRERILEVDRFEALDDVELFDVEWPIGGPPAANTRSVQAFTDPRLHSPAVALTHRPRVAVLRDARLATNGGAVISQDNRLVLETLWDEEHRRRHFVPAPRLPPAVRLTGRHASIVSLWSENYFHWLFEGLPRLAVLQASGVGYDSLIVPERLSAFHRETLDVLGIPAESLTPFAGEHIQAEELVWVAPPAPIGRPTPHTIGWLRESLCDALPPATRSRRIYLRRPGSRRVANERAVLRALHHLAFEVIDPSVLSFREQVQLFASSDVAIGPHGAAFANGIFSDALSVLEFYQPSYVNASIVSVMAAAGHQHWSLVCRRVPSLHRVRHHAVWVGPHLVQRSLEMMGVT